MVAAYDSGTSRYVFLLYFFHNKVLETFFYKKILFLKTLWLETNLIFDFFPSSLFQFRKKLIMSNVYMCYFSCVVQYDAIRSLQFFDECRLCCRANEMLTVLDALVPIFLKNNLRNNAVTWNKQYLFLVLRGEIKFLSRVFFSRVVSRLFVTTECPYRDIM